MMDFRNAKGLHFVGASHVQNYIELVREGCLHKEALRIIPIHKKDGRKK